MITAKIRKWGNSLGLLIPRDEAELLDLKEDQEVVIDVVKTERPLKELFGFSKGNKITREEFLEIRTLLEPWDALTHMHWLR